MMITVVSMAVAIAASLSFAHRATDQNPIEVLQEDIIVKPGGAGGGNLTALDWELASGRKLNPGRSHELRDDFMGTIGKFELWDSNGVKCDAAWVSFVHDRFWADDRIVIIRRRGSEFKWEFDPPDEFESCNHMPNQTESCGGDGVPRAFFAPFKGKVYGQCDTAGSPEIVISKFRLYGA